MSYTSNVDSSWGDTIGRRSEAVDADSNQTAQDQQSHDQTDDLPELPGPRPVRIIVLLMRRHIVHMVELISHLNYYDR